MINQTINIIKEIKKSTKQTKIALIGIIILGKYTFEKRFELPIIELLTSLNTLANNCHNNIAEATKTKLVAISELLLILEAIKPKTIMLIRGFIIAHKIPANACL